MLAALGLALFAFKRVFPGDLSDPDAMDSAQIARHIAAGHGFATSIFRPLALSQSGPPQAGILPDLTRAPLYPFLLSLVFALHGGHGGGNVIVLTNLALWLACAAATYLLVRALFPAPEQSHLALLAAALFVVSGTALNTALTGLPSLLATLLVTLLWRTLARVPPSGDAGTGNAVGVGVMLGLCCLTQYSLSALLLPVFVCVFITRTPARAGKALSAAALGLLVVALPWLVRTARLAHGDPFFSFSWYGLLTGTSEYPGPDAVFRSLLPPVTPAAFVFLHPAEMGVKLGRGLAYFAAHAGEALPPLVLAPALLSGLASRAESLSVRSVRVCALVSAAGLIVAVSLFTPSAGTLLPFLPIAAVLGTGFAEDALARWTPLARRVALWGWGVGVACGLGALLGGPRPLPPVQAAIGMADNPPLPVPLNEDARKQITQGVVITDAPWDIAWRLHLPTLWLPQDNETYDALVARAGIAGPGKINAPALLLTPRVLAAPDNPQDDALSAWRDWAFHPLAWDARAQAIAAADRLPQELNARIALARRMLAEHDARVPPTADALNAQIAEAQAALPERIKAQKQQAEQDFAARYGTLSEIISDYATDPRILQQTETNHLPSTLFLRRDILRVLAARAQSDNE